MTTPSSYHNHQDKRIMQTLTFSLVLWESELLYAMEGKDGDQQMEKDAKRNWWFSLLVRIPGVKDPKNSQEGHK